MSLKGTLESRITYRIKRCGDNVFMRRDFTDIGGYDQVGRILKQLVGEGFIISLGYGLYARAKKSSFTGKIIPKKNLLELSEEALRKLRIKTAPSRAETAYNSGLSTQVPTGRTIGVKGRISRKIGYDGKFIVFEKVA